MGGTNVKPFVEEFEPYCKWQRKEGHDILEVHLEGFKKEQLRVQLENLEIIKISGERPLDESRRIRFSKEIRVSEDCKTNEIRAKFHGTILYIIMPKRTPLVLPSQVQPTISPKQDRENKKAKPEINQDNAIKYTATIELGAGEKSLNTETTVTLLTTRPLGYTFRPKDLVMVINVAIAVALVVALGAFVMYKYRQAMAFICGNDFLYIL